MTGDTELSRRIDRLEADPTIPLSSVDLTVVHPDRLRREFGEALFYFALVEGLVAQNALEVEAILPRLDENDRRFLAVWSRQEVAHGAVFDALCLELDLPPAAPVLRSPRRSFRTLGVLTRQRWWHDVFKLVYLVRGAMHERLTLDAYSRIWARFDAWGERALAATVAGPIRRQEAGHLGYYRAAATAQRARLDPAQLALARAISVRTYAPVGANRARRAQCGRAFTSIAGDDLGGLEPVQAIADQVLGHGGRPLPRFVQTAMRDCLAVR